MESRHFLSACGMLVINVLIFVIMFNFHDAIFPHDCAARPVISPPMKPDRYAPSIWYYEHIYEHPAPKLRVLSTKDGAPPLRSSIPARPREITIITQTSQDRLHAVESTAMSWGGAMSVAVHVRLTSEIVTVYESLKKIHTKVETEGRCRLFFYLAFEDGFKSDEEALAALYPINTLRNIALRTATTELVFLLDADFVPSPGLHESLTKDERKYKELVRKAEQEKTLLVVPAFELKETATTNMPRSKEELRKGWRNGSYDCFHCLHSPKAHQPSDNEKFMDPGTTTPYPVTYREMYEPYVIAAVDRIPSYDDRFRGYGKNKLSHSYHCAALGMGFAVLPEGFVFALPHPFSKARDIYFGINHDPLQRLRIAGLYRRFKTEVSSLTPN